MKLTYYCTGLDSDYTNIASDFDALINDQSIFFREDTVKDIYVDYDFTIDVPEFVGFRKPDYVKIDYDDTRVPTRYAFITSYEEIAPAIYRIRLQFDFINPSLGTWHLVLNSELELSHFPLYTGLYWQPRVPKYQPNVVPSRVIYHPYVDRLRFVVTVGLDPTEFVFGKKRYHSRYFISTDFDRSELSTIAANIFRVITEFKNMIITKTFDGVSVTDTAVSYNENNADIYDIKEFPNIYIVPADFSPLTRDYDTTKYNAILAPNIGSSTGTQLNMFVPNDVIYGYSITHSHITLELPFAPNSTRPNEFMRVGNPLSFIDIPFSPNFETYAYVKIAWNVNGDFQCRLEYGDKSVDLASSYLYMHDVDIEATTQASMGISSAISILGGVVTTAGGIATQNPLAIAGGALATSSAIGNAVNAPSVGNFGGSGNAMLALTFGGEAGGYPTFTNGFCVMIYSCANIREIDDDIDRYGGVCNVSGIVHGYNVIDITDIGNNRRMYFKFRHVNAVASGSIQVTNDPRFAPLMKQILERGVTVWNTRRAYIGSVGLWNE